MCIYRGERRLREFLKIFRIGGLGVRGRIFISLGWMIVWVLFVSIFLILVLGFFSCVFFSLILSLISATID